MWVKDKKSWAASSTDQISKVDEGMGEFLIVPSMREFIVLESSD